MKVKAGLTRRIFFLILLVTLIIFFISIPLTHFNSLRLYLWKAGSSFYDFFESVKNNIYWNRGKCYENGSIYPPLANLFYAVITRCMSVETLRKLESLSDYNKIKALQECSFFFIVYTSITLLFFYLICTEWKKGTKLEKNVFTIAMLFTVPFLYQFERANIIFVALLFTMVFFLWKDSENKVLRELSYISLAVAAGLKIYPALFGVLIVREKKYKDAIRLLLYGIGVFILPFVFYGGFQNVSVLLENIMKTSDTFSMTRVGCQLDYVTILKHLFAFCGGNSIFIGKVIRGAFIFLGVWAIFGLKQKWKMTLLLTCIVLGFPSISYVYTAIFMIIPIVMYLDSANKKKWDLVYLAGMLLVIIPLPFCWREGAGDKYYSYMNISTPVLVEGLSIVIMTFLLICEGVLAFFRKRQTFLASVAMLASVVLVSVLGNKSSYNAPYAYTDYLSKTLSDRLEASNGDIVRQYFKANEEFLNYIILKLNPAQSGTLTVKINQTDDAVEVFEQSYVMNTLEKGYNQIVLDNCSLRPGKQYILEIEIKCGADEKVKLWRTVENFDPGSEYFELNHDRLAGALGIQLYESSEEAD